MSTVGPISEYPYLTIQEGASLVCKGVNTIFQGIGSVGKGLLKVTAGVFLVLNFLLVTLFITTIVFLLRITPPPGKCISAFYSLEYLGLGIWLT